MPIEYTEVTRVLLIGERAEDYNFMLHLFEELGGAGYRVEWLSDGRRALAAILEARHDVYFVDYRLSPGDGLTVVRAAAGAGVRAPLVLIAAESDRKMDFEALRAGAADFLVKGELTAPLLERVISYSLAHARALERMQASETKFRSVVESASDAIFLVDQDGQVILWNAAAEKIFGYTAAEIIGRSPVHLMGEKYARKALETGVRRTIEQVLAPMAGRIIEAAGRRRDGSEFPLELSGAVWRTSEGLFYTGIIRDVTARRQAEARLVHEATHDALTGLPNRTQFAGILGDAIDFARAAGRYEFAVLFLDLDRFKIVNDSLGHVVGDRLLVAIAGRLKAAVRPGDVVARFGGDEFTVLLHNIERPEAATEIAARLQRALGAPFMIDGHEIFSSASIGIALGDPLYGRPEDFLRNADAAMYRAKDLGKARCEVFENAMRERSVGLLQLENDLRRALDRDEFKVFYQPIVSLRTGEIREFEALVRWHHPAHGLIAPADFIVIAEETGLIVPLGKWVLEESCRQISRWEQRYQEERPLSISVNLSVKQLMSGDLIREVEEVIGRTAIAPDRLKLEVTETMVMKNPDLALDVLSQLCRLGVRLSSDDFGTGYSSLSYLHRFPFQRLKIDRSFIGKMDTDPKSEEIVGTILKMAENLNLDVVAEGIESDRQLLRLRELGCHFGQGYLFSKPVSAAEIDDLMRRGGRVELPFLSTDLLLPSDLDIIADVARIQHLAELMMSSRK